MNVQSGERMTSVPFTRNVTSPALDEGIDSLKVLR